VPFALPLAIGFAFFDLVPLVGATIGGILVAIVVGFTADLPVALIVWGGVLLLYQQVENNVLAPYVYGQAVRVHPLGILVGILIGAALLGILGALVAIPVSAAIQAVVRDYWAYSDRDLTRVAKQAAAAVDPDEDEREVPGAAG
jgi:predicted PurR-regulated permease PerM